jgi:alpha-tubulin suppressor-like RCC1 family protein
MVQLHADEPQLDLMEKQLFESFDDFCNNDFGTFYLGGNYSSLHYLHSDLRPYRNHLDIKRVNLGTKANTSMIFLLESGQVYGLGQNKAKHFVDQDQKKFFDQEQQIPFYDAKDQIITIESYKRCTVAVTKKGKVYAVGEKLQKMLKIKNERFGFYPLPLEDPKEELEGQAQAQEEEKKEGESP